MKIIGCDFHTRYQQMAMLDEATGELIERRLDHASGEAQAFYRELQGPGAKQFAGLAESSPRQAVRLQGQADFRKRGSLDHGLHNHIPGTTRIHCEYLGVPQRQGCLRNTVFRGSLRGAGLAEAMGSAEHVMRHQG